MAWVRLAASIFSLGPLLTSKASIMPKADTKSRKAKGKAEGKRKKSKSDIDLQVSLC
jgi:hypothetical protein